MKNETEQKRGHLVRKMTLEKKETANDAHGGVRHKKGMNQARSGSKSPVCRLYAHGVRRVVHRGAPQVPPHCAVLFRGFACGGNIGRDGVNSLSKRHRKIQGESMVKAR